MLFNLTSRIILTINASERWVYDRETVLFYRASGRHAGHCPCIGAYRRSAYNAWGDGILCRRFDRFAAGAVIRAKRSHPHITLELLLPYHPSERPIEPPNGFDGTFYPPGMECVPRRLAILKANHYTVDHSDCIVAYVRHPGNARNLLEYARKRGIPVWEV